MKNPNSFGRLVCSLCLLLIAAIVPGTTCNFPPPPGQPPNILFIILDDVGIDQLTSFNPNSVDPPYTPNINAIAVAGVKFTNCWMMPECSPSRVSFITGRWPLRTGVTAAFTPVDLCNAQCSRYETTTPQVLHAANYKSAHIGKFHIAGPDNNPDAFGTPAALGWDYYNGTLQGAPPAIDPTLGGQYTCDPTDQPCKYCWGFPFGTDARGAGWFLNSSNEPVCRDNFGQGFAGSEIAALGGIAALDVNGDFAATCADAAGPPDFNYNGNGYNGYYAQPNIINENGDVIPPTTQRGYATVLQTNAMIQWIRNRSRIFNRSEPWFATMAYSSIHAPYQPPPEDLWPEGFVWPEGVDPTDCGNAETIQVVSKLMLSAMDKEIGRLLVSTGLATRDSNGNLVYDPSASNTMIVIAGDNGTYYSSVQSPYDPLRAKGTPYQTGVLAPLIVAGPLVVQPGRSVDYMVNSADLFQLWGEIAGVDVRNSVPSAHTLDCQPMLAYLTNPDQTAIRTWNFSQVGSGLKSQATKETIYPCVLTIAGEYACTDQIFYDESLCKTEGGVWFGPSGDEPAQYDSCCDIKINDPQYANMTIEPIATWTVRNEQYKLIMFERETQTGCDDGAQYEFYDLSQGPPPYLDTADKNLLRTNAPPLNQEQLDNYNSLLAQMNDILASEAACYDDGNLDKQINQEDVDGVNMYMGVGSSWFDINHDGLTDQNDLDCVNANLGADCLNGDSGTECPQ